MIISRYLLLFLFNSPFVLLGYLNSLVSYKLKKISKSKFILRVIIWTAIFMGLIFAQPLYVFLFSNNLTDTEPLSLFDVIQITGIVITFYLANRAFEKADNLERRLQNLHREVSIKLSTKK